MMEFTTSPYSVHDNTTYAPSFDVIYGKTDKLVETLMYIIAASAIPGNILTILVLTSSKKLRNKPINVFLIHQSCIDTLACIFTFVEQILRHQNTLNLLQCKIFLTKVASSVCLYTSTYNITALTIERFLAIKDPLGYNPTKVLRRLPLVFLSIWCISILSQLIILITTTVKYNYCLPVYKIHYTFWIDYIGYQNLNISLVIPLSIMIYCYSRIFSAMLKSTNLKSSQSDKMRSAQRNMLETCLIITILFVICWMTNELGLLLAIVRYYENLNNKIYRYGRLLILLNSGINPYVYVVRYDDFKTQLKTLLSWKHSNTKKEETQRLEQ